MKKKKLSSFTGILSMDLLFVGSKSEGLYPVLHISNGQKFRLHYKGDVSLNEKILSSYNSKTVQVVGYADNLRGHWRIVLPIDSFPKEVESPQDGLEIVQQKTLPQVTSDALEQPSALETKKISKKNNLAEE